MDTISLYKNFLDEGKTERECCRKIIALAEEKGYRNLKDMDCVKAGDKVYVEKFSKAVALFDVGSAPLCEGMNILGAHIDSPRLDLKQKPLYESDFIVYLNTHYYGGIKKYQWVTIPLAIHGVVCLKNGSVLDITIGEDEDDPVFCISDILPHLAQKQMEGNAREFIPGESLDLIAGSSCPAPKNETEEEKKDRVTAKKNVLAILKQKYGMEEDDFLSAELEVVPAGKTRDLGLDRSLILGYGQDDRSCAFTSLMALLGSKAGKRTNCCLCVDKEEIGSVGATGMESRLFENFVAELLEKCGDDSHSALRNCLCNSMMLSSDVNAAYDPMNGGLFDKDNASFLGGGIVLNKYTGSRGKSGASDANPEFIAKIRNVFDRDGVTFQMAELGKVDQGGGGTIAYHAARYGMSVLDAGVSVLSMHAPWEITARYDIEEAVKAYRSFLTLE